MAEFVTIIASGGSSKRFGKAKSTQLLGGASLIERAIVFARLFDGPVALAARTSSQHNGFDLPILVDPSPELGPIGALASGFEFCEQAGCHQVLLIGCDQPFLPRDLPYRLDEAIGDAGVALPVSDGHDQNMAGLWRYNSDLLNHYLNDGHRSLWGFAERVGIARVFWDEIGGDPFADIDTPADLAKAQARIKGA